MNSSHSIPSQDLPPGAVGRAGPWAVGNRDGAHFAVSRFCRHQLADLSGGSIDANGCLVCPWHGARYDVRDGRMVRGPRGFFGYHGPSRGYREFVRAYSQLIPLRRREAVVRGDRVEVRTDREGSTS